MDDEEYWSHLETLVLLRIHLLESRLADYGNWKTGHRAAELFECWKNELECYKDLKKFVDKKKG